MLVAVTADFVSKFEHKREFQNWKAIIQLKIDSMFCKAIVIVIAALHCSFQRRKKNCNVSLSLTNCLLHTYFWICHKKKLLDTQLARRATCDLKALARRIIPLAPGYRTALLSHPGNYVCSKQDPLSHFRGCKWGYLVFDRGRLELKELLWQQY